MIKNSLAYKFRGLFFFERWHPEVALRYLPIVDEIKKGDRNSSVLEVGSGGLGIAPYLKRQFTGVDLEFSSPVHPLLNKVKADATKLPFPDSSFDFVLSADMLEHLPPQKRELAIMEMLRVAVIKVIIAVPCGSPAHMEDQELDKYYKKVFGTNYHFLTEQELYGLPEKEDIIKIFYHLGNSLNKKVKVRTIANENLKVHNFLMKGWMTKNIFKNIFFRKIMLFFLPLLKTLNQEPAYRQIFIIEFIK